MGFISSNNVHAFAIVDLSHGQRRHVVWRLVVIYVDGYLQTNIATHFWCTTTYDSQMRTCQLCVKDHIGGTSPFSTLTFPFLKNVECNNCIRKARGTIWLVWLMKCSLLWIIPSNFYSLSIYMTY